MGLFTKYCTLCGMKIEKHQGIVKFGKHFDSKQHADLYSEQKEESNEPHTEYSRQSHGCC